MIRISWPHRLGRRSERSTAAPGRAGGWGGKPAISRLSAPRLLVGSVALAALCCLSGLLATSGASFTYGSHNEDNVFTAGTISLINSSGGMYVVEASGLRPGQSAAGTLMLTNEGDFTAGCVVGTGSIVDTPSSPGLSRALAVKIEDVTGAAQTVWTGPAEALTSAAIGRLAIGETRSYRVTISFPQAGADPRLQGASTTIELVFTGVTE